MISDDIRQELFSYQDLEYRDFMLNLTPTIGREQLIGVRTPELRAMAKRVSKEADIETFLRDVPHRYFEENQLHSFIISGMKDYDACIEEVRKCLPYVDNWATCDQMNPKVFAKHRPELLGEIRTWLTSGETYAIRFAIRMLMNYFLEEDFDLCYPDLVAAVDSEEYYVRMMVAWYFATALAKQYEAIVPYIE